MLTPSVQDSPDPVQVRGRVGDNLDLERSLRPPGLEAEVEESGPVSTISLMSLRLCDEAETAALAPCEGQVCGLQHLPPCRAAACRCGADRSSS